jgi:hypothetical protein
VCNDDVQLPRVVIEAKRHLARCAESSSRLLLHARVGLDKEDLSESLIAAIA